MEYDYATEDSEPTNCEDDEMMKHKFVCYFVMNISCIE